MANENDNLSNTAPEQPEISESVQNTLNAIMGMKGGEAAAKDLYDSAKTKVAEKTDNLPGNKTELDPATGKPKVDNAAATTKPEDKNTPPAKKQDDNKPDPAKKGHEVETPLFGKQKLGGKEEVKADLETFSDKQNAYVKATYGVDSVDKLLTDIAPKWREQAQKAAEFEKQNQEFTNVFEKMPPKLFDAIKAHFDGKNWEESIQNAPRLDFNKKPDDIGKQALVDHYFPGKFSKEDFDPGEENKAVDLTYEAAVKLFNSDKISFDSQRAKMIADQDSRIASFEKSIDGSVDMLKKELPLVNELAVKDVHESLKGGAQSILGEFLNKDGSLKPDAAIKMAMVKHGLQTLNAYMTVAKHTGETEALEDLVTNAPDKLKNNTAGGENKLSPHVLEQLESLKGLNKKRTY